jgi:seryl-tRNA synthetase
LDVRLVDRQWDEKVQQQTQRTWSTEQEIEISKVRLELTNMTNQLRHANENELPEEELRLAEDTKRKELNDLIAAFTMLNKDSFPTSSTMKSNVRTSRGDNGTTSKTMDIERRRHTGTGWGFSNPSTSTGTNGSK